MVMYNFCLYKWFRKIKMPIDINVPLFLCYNLLYIENICFEPLYGTLGVWIFHKLQRQWLRNLFSKLGYADTPRVYSRLRIARA